MEGISFYSEPQYWRGILVLANTWKWAGYGIVIYLATIAGVDPNLYESADLDGANRLQKMAHITWPHVLPVVVLLTLLKVGRIFYGNFGMVYAIVKDNGMLLQTTEVIDTYVFRAMRLTGNFSMGAAMGLFQSLAGMLLILGVNGIVRRIRDDWAIF
jgi:putative aldouronate transport system permease protein